MLYKKAEARIRQYLVYLDREKYTPVSSLLEETTYPKMEWEYGETDQIFRTPPREAIDWRTINTFPHPYGCDFRTWWFRTCLSAPLELSTGDFFLEVIPGTDALVFIGDEPIGAVNPFHQKINIAPWIASGGELDVSIEAWAGHVFPGYHPEEGSRVLTTVSMRQGGYPLLFAEPRLLIRENELYELFYDASVLFETALLHGEGTLLRQKICHDLHQGLLRIDFGANRDTRRQQAVEAHEEIRHLTTLKNGTLSPQIYSIGNAHLDHAWLWPISETSRKCARTLANMVAFCDEYPEFRYLHSQPAQLMDLHKNYPSVFEKVHRAYRRGQFEPNGGMWVEADCNLTGGESLIRQFLHGHQATLELFSYTGDVLWLPDVFGYTACLPQIMKGCGIKWFVTSKINWNDTTRFPYDLFRWKGIDGTEIPTHFITTDYEGRNTPDDITTAWRAVQHKDIQHALLRPIGEGDGGGGTTRLDLEYMRRMENLQGLPRNHWCGLSESLRSICPDPSKLPVFRGELYLELHRGTYTTQAHIKRLNRKLEYLLREAELRSILIELFGGSEKTVLRREQVRIITHSWQRILTLQFHDILPGTSIRRVNEETVNEYIEIERLLMELIREAESVISDRTSHGYTIFNSLPFTRTSIFCLPADSNVAESNHFQEITDIAGSRYLLGVASVDGFARSLAITGKRRGETAKLDVSHSGGGFFSIDGNSISTPWYTFCLDDRGGFTDFGLNGVDRPVVAPDAALNTLLDVEDLPVKWDAWDIEDDYRTKERRTGTLVSQKVQSIGPICLHLQQTLRIGTASELSQDIFFYAHTRRIDFRTRVDWRESHRLLRVDFPVGLDVDEAWFDIPFGFVKRPTHKNYPQDQARFEVCAHKWACLKDSGLLAAVMSDCKYGYRVTEGALSLTLLRSPGAPDPEADRGQHEFTYSFYADSDPDISAVIKEGWDLNIPLTVSKGLSRKEVMEPLWTVPSENLMIESAKISEDETGFILRLWENTGTPSEAVLRLNPELGMTTYMETDMLENPIGPEREIGKELTLSFRGFEIKTIKIVL